MKLIYSVLFSFCFHPAVFGSTALDKALPGAWTTTLEDNSTAVWIITEGYFSIAYYHSSKPEFLYTEGGLWAVDNGKIELTWEFHTGNSELVGQKKISAMSIKGNVLEIETRKWNRMDDGTPGALPGAWLITGRKINDQMNTITPGARKTMKILSGTRFQWIAYNSETGDFFGTGGGHYTTENGKYTEHIDFFSRDNSRVGAALEFDFKKDEDRNWHHSGLSSKGKAIYEVWSIRK
ncbi:MAG: membrane or secreted protein [Cyclobacteriaceae bacterium]|nr:membrane or secreted protein [Cyclobacteriaceae bacterium]